MKILIIEDEPELRNVVQSFLEAEHFIVEYADDYQSGLEKIISYEYDCILLDIMLPDGNGMDLLKEIKAIHKKDPVIILSAKDSVDDKVNGLEIGADDYLAKPFHLAELMARIKSVIRRKNQDGENTISYKNIHIDPESRVVKIDDNELILNRKEYDLLYYFVINPEKTLQKTMLAEAIWGDYIDQADSLDFIYSQIKNLRKKLKTLNSKADFQAVYGIGYKFI
ncbi:response regulator transcription factor [Chryseobacterium polytrichastri]|uniref:DNA-binding response regulator, OmpR family, contains REC and winged-helix (WHTH) domain n=1 Tax=Chryseobacterium polytrichastri TaxID=1302687 RepID=A0A1M6YDZ2_9FLAO|nr:response regulator transcription factor [Chryseobacterium polytrichastri]SHL16343.1 DNA-binding response regulator, OmpR family, contains REC and winged-helix (wHTH) domain [Chryseobacterium polytrichastri]